MSKIERFGGNLQAFASAAQGTERTLFGETAQASDLTSQITPQFLRGWGIVGASEHPTLEDFNAALYTATQLLSYLHQIGVPEWHAEQEYYKGSICTYAGEQYQSLEDNNIGNEPPSSEWTPVLTSKNGLENLGLGEGSFVIGQPFFWPSAKMPSEIFPSMANQVFLKWNDATFSATEYPRLALVIPSLKLSDMRGEFIRVWDDGRGVDSGRALLSTQSDAIRNITGSTNSIYNSQGSSSPSTGAFSYTSNSSNVLSSGNATGVERGTYKFSASDVVPTANENRPRNIAFNFLVRAK